MKKDTIGLEGFQARHASFGFDSVNMNMDFRLDDS